MKVLAINGSPREDGNTFHALSIMAEELTNLGAETEIVHVGNELIHGCMGCGYCAESVEKQCVMTEDCVNKVALKMREADAIILGSPTYYFGIAGTMKCFLDRAFFPNYWGGHFRNKIGAVVSVVRRTGGIETVNQLRVYMTATEMIVPQLQYIPVMYGRAKGEVTQDEEGIQIMKRHAEAMVWLYRTKEAAKDIVELPKAEPFIRTNFIR